MYRVSKKEFVEQLGELLKVADTSIESVCLTDCESEVVITYKHGEEHHININLDSHLAIIKDVAKHIEY